MRSPKRRGIGVLITDHNVRETLDIIDHASIISAGDVLFEGQADGIIRAPEVRRVDPGDMDGQDRPRPPESGRSGGPLWGESGPKPVGTSWLQDMVMLA